MRIRLKHLLVANAYVAAYLSLCRTIVWEMRLRYGARSANDWATFVVALALAHATGLLGLFTVGVVYRIATGRDLNVMGNAAVLVMTVVCATVTLGSILGTYAWTYETGAP